MMVLIRVLRVEWFKLRYHDDLDNWISGSKSGDQEDNRLIHSKLAIYNVPGGLLIRILQVLNGCVIISFGCPFLMVQRGLVVRPRRMLGLLFRNLTLTRHLGLPHTLSKFFHRTCTVQPVPRGRDITYLCHNICDEIIYRAVSQNIMRLNRLCKLGASLL